MRTSYKLQVLSPKLKKLITHNLGLITSSSGFTLIELIIVFSIMAIIGTAGIASFASFSRTQTLSVATLDIGTVMNLAKSRASSQVRKGPCTTQPLDGYIVILCNIPGATNTCKTSNVDYELDAICGGVISSPSILSKNLPANVVYDTAAVTSSSYFFPIISAGVIGSGTLQVKTTVAGATVCKKITVDSGGNITFPTVCP